MSVRDLVLAASGAAGGDKQYVEDLFSNFVYRGNGSSITANSGIDLAGEGGMVWIKERFTNTSHYLFDTERGATKHLSSNSTAVEATTATSLTSFNSNGFSLGSSSIVNSSSGNPYLAYTFRKAAKFFDVVKYTGNGANRTIAHNLGSAPGCIIIKRVDSAAGNWIVYHRSVGATNWFALNLTDAAAANSTYWNNTAPTSTNFSVGTNADVNANGSIYVAYLFAHDAGSFGDTGSENAISCGSYTGNNSTTGPVVTLGWEPQWILIKRTSTTGAWALIDNARGLSMNAPDVYFNPNTATQDTTTASSFLTPTPTGFQLNTNDLLVNGTGTYVYIAVRGGLMRKPTSGATVFAPVTRTGTGALADITSPGFPADAVFTKNRGGGWTPFLCARLLFDRYLGTNSTSSESSGIAVTTTAWSVTMLGFQVPAGFGIVNSSGNSYIDYVFRRASGFFDVVGYTGDAVSGRSVSHNLKAAPELMIVKRRNSTGSWSVYAAGIGATNYLVLESANGAASSTAIWNDTAPSSTTFTLGNDASVNASGGIYVAFLFASLPGVSKVGSYTGNGSSQTINCGFASGARFFLVKRTNTTGDWFAFDSAKGIVAANDPATYINNTTADITTADAVDPTSSGIIVNQETSCNINVNGATYIYLAIA